MAEGEGLVSVDYEVSGKGEAKRLGLVGWVQNTSHGTVQGQIQGPTARVRELQEWLRKVGSPQSRISRAEFSNEKKIPALEHKDFQILK
ncbi:acylphosphatase-1 isoform 2-T2 [Ciconia maguari]